MQGKKDEAADAYRKALAVNPQYASAWSGLGQLAEMDGRLAEAERRTGKPPNRRRPIR
jgi:Flp pilus assembly protein TadD